MTRSGVIPGGRGCVVPTVWHRADKLHCGDSVEPHSKLSCARPGFPNRQLNVKYHSPGALMSYSVLCRRFGTPPSSGSNPHQPPPPKVCAHSTGHCRVRYDLWWRQGLANTHPHTHTHIPTHRRARAHEYLSFGSQPALPVGEIRAGVRILWKGVWLHQDSSTQTVGTKQNPTLDPQTSDIWPCADGLEIRGVRRELSKGFWCKRCP